MQGRKGVHVVGVKVNSISYPAEPFAQSSAKKCINQDTGSVIDRPIPHAIVAVPANIFGNVELTSAVDLARLLNPAVEVRS